MTNFLETRTSLPAETALDPVSQATEPAKSQPKDPNSTEKETTPEVEKPGSGILMIEDKARAADEAKPNDPKKETKVDEPAKAAQPSDPGKETKVDPVEPEAPETRRSRSSKDVPEDQADEVACTVPHKERP